MKMCPFTILTIGMCSWISVALAFASSDQLKPGQYQKEREFRELLDRLNREGLDYQVEVEFKEFDDFFFGKHHFEGYVTQVTLPEEIARQVDKYDSRFKRGVFKTYLENPTYSFHAAVIWVYLRQQESGRWGYGFVGPRLEPIEKHDKALWDKEMERYAGIWRGGNLTDPCGHRNKLLYDAIPQRYLQDIFSDRVHRFGSSIVEKPVNIKGKPYEDGVREFNASCNTAKLLELTLTQENLEVWLYVVISGPETNRTNITKDFCAWCRRNEPKKNAFLSAVMMGLFTVDGYSFDDEKGAYDANERGKLLLDYIVEFPIPENATRLKVIMDGGNQALLNDLMEKRDTALMWQELLRDPVPPKFVEYKQDPNPRKAGAVGGGPKNGRFRD